MRHITIILLLMMLPILTLAAENERSPLWGDLKPGEHAVGFKVVYLFDDTRTYEPVENPDQSYE